MDYETDIVAEDTRAILAALSPVLDELDGAHLFLTGGTGFIGRWLLQTIKEANAQKLSHIRVTILTRDPEVFSKRFPEYFEVPDFTFVKGDILTFAAPNETYTHVIHGATEASAYLNEHDPRKMFSTALYGTQRVLDFAVENSVNRLLFLSSGAVYGLQPWDVSHVSETWTGAPDCTNAVNTYAEAKRASEMLCAIYAKQFGLSTTSARIFGLLGPFLELDIHFAVGNFIRDALAKRPVVVNGNGLPHRSMLYTSDLVIWLFTLLVHGKQGASYNVGSDESVSIGELAELVASTLGDGIFEIKGAQDKGWNLGRYVPNVDLAAEEFNLIKSVSLQEAIKRTGQFHGWKKCED
jgi:nucleoside-diphosphate-sugar epimerase